MHVACSVVTSGPVISLSGHNPAAGFRQGCLLWLYVQRKAFKVRMSQASHLHCTVGATLWACLGHIMFQTHIPSAVYACAQGAVAWQCVLVASNIRPFVQRPKLR